MKQKRHTSRSKSQDVQDAKATAFIVTILLLVSMGISARFLMGMVDKGFRGDQVVPDKEEIPVIDTGTPNDYRDPVQVVPITDKEKNDGDIGHVTTKPTTLPEIVVTPVPTVVPVPTPVPTFVPTPVPVVTPVKPTSTTVKPTQPVSPPITTCPGGTTDCDADGWIDSCDTSMGKDAQFGTCTSEECMEIENDNCPGISNPDQNDIDADGYGDACDNDVDGDCVGNSVDMCPNVSDPDQADTDKDGTGDYCDITISNVVSYDPTVDVSATMYVVLALSIVVLGVGAGVVHNNGVLLVRFIKSRDLSIS